VRSAKKIITGSAAWAARILPASVKQALYKTPFLAKTIRRSLNAAAPEGITEITIAAGVIKGLRMALDLHKEKDYWLGTYEPDLQAAASQIIKQGMVVYDVGANIGYISLLSARLVGENGKVFSFEALPANIARLNQNVELNAMQRQIQIVHTAVVDKAGEVTFLTHASGAMGKALGSAGRDAQYTQTIKIQGISLDDFVFIQGNPHPAVVKMDIEGGEGMALAGMPRLLKEIRPVLLIELHGEEAARQVWDCLSASGYSLHPMRDGSAEIHSLSELDWKAYIIARPDLVI
jgi:FkbM family methyltransferase